MVWRAGDKGWLIALNTFLFLTSVNLFNGDLFDAYFEGTLIESILISLFTAGVMTTLQGAYRLWKSKRLKSKRLSRRRDQIKLSE